MDQALINSVIRTVRGFVPRHYDYEGLALDILFESWSNGVPVPSRDFIRNRCYDQLRREKNELTCATVPEPEPPDDSAPTRNALVGSLMMTLSPEERKVIWHRFYAGRSLADCATALRIPVEMVRQILEASLYKMRMAARE